MKKFLPFQTRNLFLCVLLFVGLIYSKASTHVTSTNDLTSVTCSTTNSNIAISACNSFTYNNQTYFVSGVYKQTLTNAGGCDSIITLILTINTINTSVVRTGFNLIALETGATYQWLDCNNNNSPIPGKTAANFYPSTNGNYAVVVTMNSCTDTSACYDISGMGIYNNESWNYDLKVYPNPSKDKITISDPPVSYKEYSIFNTLGQQILTGELREDGTEIDISPLAGGVYIIKAGNAAGRFVKN